MIKSGFAELCALRTPDIVREIPKDRFGGFAVYWRFGNDYGACVSCRPGADAYEVAPLEYIERFDDVVYAPKLGKRLGLTMIMHYYDLDAVSALLDRIAKLEKKGDKHHD